MIMGETKTHLSLIKIGHLIR